MELSMAIEQRRSIRKFKEKPFSDEILQEMLEAARLSPSGGNSQSYLFGVIKSKDTKKALAEAAGKQMWIADAPVVLACCADISHDIADAPSEDFGLIVNKGRFGEEFIRYLNDYPDRKSVMTLFQNATPLIPAEHIALTAVSHGLSTCFIGYLNIERANEILNLPKDKTCLFLLPVGYADEQAKERKLKEMKELVFYESWNQERV
jgi:nitroreductase